MTRKALKDYMAMVPRAPEAGAIYSENWEEHLEHLDKVLTSLAKEELMLNVSKCHFAQLEVKFFGRIVGSGRLCWKQI